MYSPPDDLIASTVNVDSIVDTSSGVSLSQYLAGSTDAAYADGLAAAMTPIRTRPGAQFPSASPSHAGHIPRSHSDMLSHSLPATGNALSQLAAIPTKPGTAHGAVGGSGGDSPSRMYRMDEPRLPADADMSVPWLASAVQMFGGAAIGSAGNSVSESNANTLPDIDRTTDSLDEISSSIRSKGDPGERFPLGGLIVD